MWQYLFLLTFVFLTNSLIVYSQTGRVVKGIITDEKNQALPGVSVMVAGTSNGVASDVDGKYMITINSDQAVLRFTSVGFTTKEIQVANSSTINVSLVPGANQLKDVVVIGYGTSTKQNVAGSITSLQSEEFNQGVLTTPAELLQSKVPGLNVTKSGDPNQQPAVILRGPSTLNSASGAQEPFYVIDGVPGASIDLLAPADIDLNILLDERARELSWEGWRRNDLIRFGQF
ncbi:MAG: RagB/SusD family nutrient uptake outer membrane protein [Sphingobacteriaceae bacterium]|nr:MAG: RagB/SusD family nutrient uptake outer membrane protein [Sphingobacteriaceae bacterium]